MTNPAETTAPTPNDGANNSNAPAVADTNTPADPSATPTPTTPDATPAADQTATEAKPEVKDEGKEPKADDNKPDEKKADDKKPEGAPDKYELKTADGVTIAPEVQTQFEAIARDLNLTQENAQKLLDLAPAISKMQTSQLVDLAEKTTAKWQAEALADAEIGVNGDKAAYNLNMAAIAKAKKAFATPELGALLEKFDAKTNPNGTGLGNHPEVLRLFLRLGKSISEDNKLVTGQVPDAEQTAGQKLYGNPQKK